MTNLLRDLRYALRALAQTPEFAVAAILNESGARLVCRCGNIIGFGDRAQFVWTISSGVAQPTVQRFGIEARGGRAEQGRDYDDCAE
jgi:hypothetical protein